jgi:ADP-ribosylglycohydrolase
MSQWNTPLTMLREELRQKLDEGAVLPENLVNAIGSLDPIEQGWDPLVDQYFTDLAALPSDPDLAAREPNELSVIRSLRPDGPRNLHWNPSDDELLDRMHGAWIGRATGCALGKPVELLGVRTTDGTHSGRHTIKRYLENRGDWPLTDYFSGRDVGDDLSLWCPQSTREEISYMEPDDDIHYTLIALGVLETHGPTFTWTNVADYWMSHLPPSAICTAEAQAILNFMNRTARWGSDGGARSVATPEFCRSYRNPYREWIGAQIRSDGWAWACAGNPELAAEFAYRDACWTHERNGIYGAMFFAAMQAAAFVVHDASALVEIGLSEIPADCRLAQAIRATLEICARSNDWEAAVVEIEDLTNAMSPPLMHPVHTINNACLCVMSLVLEHMHPFHSVTTSVMAGMDTDCNGATVGSIVGAAVGSSGFDSPLVAPLNDTIRPNLLGFEQVQMADLAKRMANQWHRVRSTDLVH